MKPLRSILSNTSSYIRGDRYSLVAIALLLLVFCGSTTLALLLLAHALTNGPFPLPFSGNPTQSSTPYSYLDCTGGKAYSGIWSTELEGMLFEAFLCPDGTLIAAFHDQDIPEFITMNQRAPNEIEFSWSVSIDIDSDSTTGTPAGYFEGIVGADYQMSLAHWSLGEEETVPFAEAFQANVWHYTDEGLGESISDAEQHIDVQNGLLVLRGSIPGMSLGSRVLFSRFYYSIYNELTYKTDWVISGR